jgi:hypothetical protein
MNAVVEKTRDEIQALMDNWKRDPVWDLAQTEGFEAHSKELAEYQAQMEAGWSIRAAQEEALRQHRIEDKAVELGVPGNTALARYIMALEARIRELERHVLH